MKLCQLMASLSELWVIVVVAPLLLMVPVPVVTVPWVGLARP